MTAAERAAAVQAFAVLLNAWIDGRTHPSDRSDVCRKPKKRSDNIAAAADRLRRA